MIKGPISILFTVYSSSYCSHTTKKFGYVINFNLKFSSTLPDKVLGTVQTIRPFSHFVFCSRNSIFSDCSLHSIKSKLLGSSQSGAICFSRLPVFSHPFPFSLYSSHKSNYPCKVPETPCSFFFHAFTNLYKMPPLVLALELPHIKGCLLPFFTKAKLVFGSTETLRNGLHSSIS